MLLNFFATKFIGQIYLVQRQWRSDSAWCSDSRRPTDRGRNSGFAKRGRVSSGILRSNIVLVAALGATSA